MDGLVVTLDVVELPAHSSHCPNGLNSDRSKGKPELNEAGGSLSTPVPVVTAVLGTRPDTVTRRDYELVRYDGASTLL